MNAQNEHMLSIRKLNVQWNCPFTASLTDVAFKISGKKKKISGKDINHLFKKSGHTGWHVKIKAESYPDESQIYSRWNGIFTLFKYEQILKISHI